MVTFRAPLKRAFTPNFLSEHTQDAILAWSFQPFSYLTQYFCPLAAFFSCAYTKWWKTDVCNHLLKFLSFYCKADLYVVVLPEKVYWTPGKTKAKKRSYIPLRPTLASNEWSCSMSSSLGGNSLLALIKTCNKIPVPPLDTNTPTLRPLPTTEKHRKALNMTKHNSAQDKSHLVKYWYYKSQLDSQFSTTLVFKETVTNYQSCCI